MFLIYKFLIKTFVRELIRVWKKYLHIILDEVFSDWHADFIRSWLNLTACLVQISIDYSFFALVLTYLRKPVFWKHSILTGL